MMARIDEYEIFVRFIGEKVKQSKLESIARDSGTGHGYYLDRYMFR